MIVNRVRRVPERERALVLDRRHVVEAHAH